MALSVHDRRGLVERSAAAAILDRHGKGEQPLMLEPPEILERKRAVAVMLRGAHGELRGQAARGAVPDVTRVLRRRRQRVAADECAVHAWLWRGQHGARRSIAPANGRRCCAQSSRRWRAATTWPAQAPRRASSISSIRAIPSMIGSSLQRPASGRAAQLSAPGRTGAVRLEAQGGSIFRIRRNRRWAVTAAAGADRQEGARGCGGHRSFSSEPSPSATAEPSAQRSPGRRPRFSCISKAPASCCSNRRCSRDFARPDTAVNQDKLAVCDS